MANFRITSNADTVNRTYSVHQIDLDTMLHNGECQPEDEIIFEVNGSEVKAYFRNGGHIIDPGKDAELAAALIANRAKLEIYQ
ncbi:MAG: hypothetical protein KDC70_00155 [Saprospiraceae bacterium]|nr:hypothetical protein [Saprospiraceae bacterium]